MNQIRFTLNAVEQSCAVEPRTTLAELLRDGLGMTGTHVGCEQGFCGSCTVLLDGEPVRACLLLAVQVDGHAVETVEGLAEDGEPTALQRRFAERNALQCGFCTPGILMSLTAAERAKLSAAEVETTVLAGHLCRCTGYEAVRAAIREHWEAR
ncbi:(2Fe-2S)-binding protein [Actinokineospora sp. NPDC004072]